MPGVLIAGHWRRAWMRCKLDGHASSLNWSQKTFSIFNGPRLARMKGLLAAIFLNVSSCIGAAQGAVPSDAETEVWFKTLLPKPEGGWQRFTVGRGEAIYSSLDEG